MKDIGYSSNIVANMARVLVYVTSILFANYGTEAFIGMKWGRQSAQRLVPSQVVDLLMQNGIKHARLYSSEEDILEAFVARRYPCLKPPPSGICPTPECGKRSKYLKHSNIRMVTVGGYVFIEGLRDKAIIQSGMASLKNLQQALNEVGHDEITVNFVHYQKMLKPNITRPSVAEFRDEIKYELTQYVRFLQARKAPFLVEMFPILDARGNNFNMSFAFLDNKSAQDAVKDVNGAVYTNVFEFVYDSFVWALSKINASDVRVVVTQVGWPTDGHVGGTVANAERFFKHLLPLVASYKGTPMRPGAPIGIYVHALTDETKMVYADSFTRHWGVFRSNGMPKYKIDLSGRGCNVYPKTVPGIMKMPKRWCVFNVKSQLNIACQKGDCSSTTPGGSCGHLSFDQNVSYAFNMLFQFKCQDEKTCDFQGLGQVSVEDPSIGECVFPIEVVKGKQLNLYIS